ncbi:hypothetical protein [Nostoc sp. FACHB-133]|uniref:hypothetical protein n=1 Tax=Nostoc sp. FACHB-133 TaxID=2692835 RepID=UPI00199F3E73|nr:hypothetical protein [Nostoc sp. FACHB-133]MBD2527953.1 hypothetical protein [Nostoc sp. FACHB-133]
MFTAFISTKLPKQNTDKYFLFNLFSFKQKVSLLITFSLLTLPITLLGCNSSNQTGHAKQQQIADMYYEMKLLTKKIDIREVILSPEEYAKITPQKLTSKQ